MNTLVINLYGGPGVGKSTCATYLYSKLKMLNINVEYVSEFAKDLTWENNKVALGCQMYVTGEQIYRLRRLQNKCDVIINDSPILLGAIYGVNDNPYLSKPLKYEYDKFNNMDIVITRTTTYSTNGRKEDEKTAKDIDDSIIDLLYLNKIEYVEITNDIDTLDLLVKLIINRLKE